MDVMLSRLPRHHLSICMGRPPSLRSIHPFHPLMDCLVQVSARRGHAPRRRSAEFLGTATRLTREYPCRHSRHLLGSPLFPQNPQRTNQSPHHLTPILKHALPYRIITTTMHQRPSLSISRTKRSRRCPPPLGLFLLEYRRRPQPWERPQPQ